MYTCLLNSYREISNHPILLSLSFRVLYGSQGRLYKPRDSAKTFLKKEKDSANIATPDHKQRLQRFQVYEHITKFQGL